MLGLTACGHPCHQGRQCDRFPCAGLHADPLAALTPEQRRALREADDADWLGHPLYRIACAVVVVATMVASSFFPWGFAQ